MLILKIEIAKVGGFEGAKKEKVTKQNLEPYECLSLYVITHSF